MHFEELSKYIIPVLFLLYFFSGKKKKQPQKRVEKQEQIAPRVPKREVQPVARSSKMESMTSSAAPVHRKLSHLESAIETRRLPGRIEERHYVSSISDDRAAGLISAGLNEHIDIDQAYALKPRKRISRGKAMINRLSSPKDIFVLQVIMNRYDS